jgi:hypothetical protein
MSTSKLTPLERQEIKALNQWMKVNGYTHVTLAQATGDFYTHIGPMVAGHKRISEGFKFRFGEAFGDEARNQLFRHPEPA